MAFVPPARFSRAWLALQRRRHAGRSLARERQTSSLPGRRMGSRALPRQDQFEFPHCDGSGAEQTNRWFDDEYAFVFANKATCG